VIALSLFGSGCIEAESRVCSWGGTCPPGLLCHADTEQCVAPSQLTDCVGSPDGDLCQVAGRSTPFLCRGEVCLPSVCGDGLTDNRPEAGEVCDDGNTDAGDGCRADCRGTEVCGDGLVDEVLGEGCDDANLDDEDGCTVLCQQPYCGDGLRTGGEACDDGEGNSDALPDACRTNCRLPGCGDQVLDRAERGRCWLLTGNGRQATGPRPAGLAVGDLDGDGLADLLVASQDASSLSVFLSDGLGGLNRVTGSPFALAHPVTAAAMGDLDGDGTSDVVVVSGDGHAAWLSGDGAGNLGPPIHALYAASFTAVTVVDLAGDGASQILATDQQAGLLWVLRVNTSQDLEVVASHTVGAAGAQPVAVVSADLDGDGRPEVAVALRAYAQLGLLTANSAGSLVPVAGFPWHVGEHWSSTVTDVIIADANGDGHRDLVWLDVRRWSSSFVGTLLGDGSLGFTSDASGLIELGPGAAQFAAGDLDADGRVDLLIPRVTDTSAYLLLGDAAVPFVLDPAGPVILQASSRVIALADFDGDGLVDLVLADHHAGYVDLYLNAP